MFSPPRVAAVFATMNRAQTAVSCVRALAAQTLPPQMVVVADNVSMDDTVAMLESMGDLPFELNVIRMLENLGNAGGVRDAMDLAFASGVDAVWILDDDSWPRQEALAAMVEAPWDPRVVCHALQIDPKTGFFTWPLWVESECGWKIAFHENDLPEGRRLTSRASWTGALVSREAWGNTGPVNGELFIRGEDEEYPWRLEQQGFRFACVRSAILDHPGPERLVHWQLLGKNFFFESGLADWKLHYKVRNMVWLKRRQSGCIAAFTMALSYAFATSWIDGPQRLTLVWNAARDGWKGKLGKWKQHP